MKKKPVRQYFDTKIDVLCSLVEENKCNASILKKIQHELTFRSSRKSKKLAETIKQFLLQTPKAEHSEQKPEQLQLPTSQTAYNTPPFGKQTKELLKKFEEKQQNMSED